MILSLQAEAELRMIQHSFDEQAEQTRSVLKKIVETHVSGYCGSCELLCIM